MSIRVQMLTLTSAIALAATAMVIAAVPPRAEAQTTALSDLADIANTLVATISGGVVPSPGQIQALGSAGMAVQADASNHGPCEGAIAFLGESAVSLSMRMSELSTLARFESELVSLEIVAIEASDVEAELQTVCAPTPPPDAADTGSGGIGASDAGSGRLAFAALIASALVVASRVATGHRELVSEGKRHDTIGERANTS